MRRFPAESISLESPMASQIPRGTGLPDNEVDAENTKGQEVQSSAERLDPAVPEINHP
jgi:hypothetical protein